MIQNDTGATLLLEKELDSNSLISPFFWRQQASHKVRSDWVWGFVTTKYDPDIAGSVTVIPMFHGTNKPTEFALLRGFEVHDGEPLTVGDWNGDGRNELIVVDWEGQQRAFGFGGRPLETVALMPSNANLVKHQPRVVDVNGDGRSELVFLSMDAPLAGGVSMLSISDASGKPLPGLPLELDPPSVSPMVIASGQSGAKRLVFVREDGEVSVYETKNRHLYNVASVSPNAARNVSIAAADLNSDGEDEIFIATGSDSLDCIVVGPTAVSPDSMFEREHSAIVAVASGLKRDGSSVVCFYDQTFRQFGFLWASHLSWVPHMTSGLHQRLVSLSRYPATGKGGDIFVATFFEPATNRDVETVFEKRATPEMRKALTESPPEEDAGDQRPELMRFLLIENFGERKVDEMLLQPATMEVCLLDSDGNVVGGAPVRISGVHPFVEEDETCVLRPAVLYDKKKLFLLIGFYEDTADCAAYVRMYEVPYS
ncbi:FG-GAP repeat domain-containing protein [Planctomycetota bacterium]